MENRHLTFEDFETYQKVNTYLSNNVKKTDDFSILPKPKWLFVIIISVVAFLCFYGLTVILFGEEFWLRSVTGNS